MDRVILNAKRKFDEPTASKTEQKPEPKKPKERLHPNMAEFAAEIYEYDSDDRPELWQIPPPTATEVETDVESDLDEDDLAINYRHGKNLYAEIWDDDYDISAGTKNVTIDKGAWTKDKRSLAKFGEKAKRKFSQAHPASELIYKFEHLADKQPIDFFRLFLTEDFLDNVVKQSNEYAAQKGVGEDFIEFTRKDLDKFFGVLFYSGYMKLPYESAYFDGDINDFIRRSISEKRFNQIKQYLHFVDNSSLDKSDQYCKVRPLFNELNQNLSQFGFFHQKMTMIRMDTHDVKLKGTGTNFAIWTFNTFMLVSESGFPYRVILYPDSELKLNPALDDDDDDDDEEEEEEEEDIKSGDKEAIPVEPMHLQVVKKLTVDLPPTVDLFLFDYFASPAVLQYLTEERPLSVTAGLYRYKSLARERFLNSTSLEMLKKRIRRSVETRGKYQAETNGKLTACRFLDVMDANDVIFSNRYSVEPLHQVTEYRGRRPRKEYIKPDISYQFDKVVEKCGKFTQALKKWQPRIQCGRWYWPLVVHAINLASMAAFNLYREFHSNEDVFQFRRRLTNQLLSGNTYLNIEHDPLLDPLIDLKLRFAPRGDQENDDDEYW